MTKPKMKPSTWLAALVCVSLVIGYALIAQAKQTGEAFKDLTPEGDIIYLLANSSVIVGPDVNGQSEEVTFTGTVHVPKFPAPGFERRQLADGKYQIDFELTRSELQGESYLLGGPLTLGEHPDLPSHGTITQRTPGKDYPSDFIVQRKVLIETPVGTLYNEDPVPVRGTIDSIPPVRRHNTATGIDVFRGEELPVAMLNEEGKIGGWFYSKAHLAFAVDPKAIYRMNVAGQVGFRVKGEQELISVEGPIEVVEINGSDQVEVVKLALRGYSKLLEGPIMLTELFSDKEYHSTGSLKTGVGKASYGDPAIRLYLDIKSPAGTLLVEDPIVMHGRASEAVQTSQVALHDRQVPVFTTHLEVAGGSEHPMLDEAEREVGSVTTLSFTTAEVVGQRPCCPKASSTAAAATTAAGDR